MTSAVLKISSLSVATTLIVAACSNTPGTFTSADSDAISRASGMTTAESIATGAPGGAMISAVTFIIAKHEATEHQRRIAEQRARAVYLKLSAKQKAIVRKTRYIAVDTVRDEHTSPRAKKAVMLWDTQSEQVVGNNVYDVQTPPPVGSTARFETYSAEYVGSGT